MAGAGVHRSTRRQPAGRDAVGTPVAATSLGAPEVFHPLPSKP